MNCITRKEEEEGAPPSISWVGLGPATQAIHGKLAFEAVTSFFEAPSNKAYKLCSNDMPYWKPEIEYHDSVNLGQVLFPAKMARSVMVSIDQNRRRIKKKNHIKPVINTREIFIGSSKQPREFLPLVPGFVRSLESLRSLEKSEDFVQIRLSPSSKNLSLPVPVETLPDLEIRISFDNENKTSSIKDVRLVDRKEMDFLQPESVVDLRFVRNKCVYAKNDSIDPRIASFVQNSHFDYWGIGRIKTPPGLSLSVPALAIQPHRNFDPKRYETLPVDYASYGLEHRSSLTMPYQEPDSWPTLTYTNIEAGPLGGRRDEVSMHNLRFASKRISPTDHPDPSAVSNMEDNEPLSNDDHTSMLFHKTDSLIETIELAASDQSVKLMDRGQGLTKGLSMPELQRWRRTKMKTVRRVGTVGNPKQGTIFRPGYVPRVNETVRRVVADHLV